MLLDFSFLELCVLAGMFRNRFCSVPASTLYNLEARYLCYSYMYSMDFVIDDYFRCYTFSCILTVFLLVVSSCYILHMFSLYFRNYIESSIILNDLSKLCVQCMFPPVIDVIWETFISSKLWSECIWIFKLIHDCNHFVVFCFDFRFYCIVFQFTFDYYH